jgi:hypothetical protein
MAVTPILAVPSGALCRRTYCASRGRGAVLVLDGLGDLRVDDGCAERGPERSWLC